MINKITYKEQMSNSSNIHALCNAPLAAHACNPALSRGRLFPEAESAMKTPFQRDRDRIIHSGAFRKLKYKTQVFVYHIGDYYRTRLTHSIEVAQIARSITRALNLNEDLAEAVALAHDLGHTPFGHAGEDALADAMASYGGFDHNDQALRILTQLEQRYADFDGLNLSWEALEGVVKHNGPLTGKKLPTTIANFKSVWDLEIDSWPSLEAQVAALSDDIAYNNHDIDDGIRSGLLKFESLRELPVVGAIIDELKNKYPDLDQKRMVYETIRRMINAMIVDLVEQTQKNLAALNPQSADDIRRAGRAMVEFSPVMRAHVLTIRNFLMTCMYRHSRVNRMSNKAKRVVTELFHEFMAQPNLLPTEWFHLVRKNEAEINKARLIADYIAGMTDNYALLEHKRIFDVYEKP